MALALCFSNVTVNLDKRSGHPFGSEISVEKNLSLKIFDSQPVVYTECLLPWSFLFQHTGRRFLEINKQPSMYNEDTYFRCILLCLLLKWYLCILSWIFKLRVSYLLGYQDATFPGFRWARSNLKMRWQGFHVIFQRNPTCSTEKHVVYSWSASSLLVVRYLTTCLCCCAEF